MNLANRLGTKLYSHLKNGIKKSDFLVDLNSMTSVVVFFFILHLSCSTVLHVDPFLKVL